MNKIKLIIFVILCAVSFELLSATIPFRLGEILSAEISRNKVTIKNLNAADYNIKFKHYAYAVVALKLQPGRSISIYDFKLKFKNKEYKCVALRSGSKHFNTKNWQFSKTSPRVLYSLLFIVNSEYLGNAKKTLTADLLYALNKSGKFDYPLPFKFVNYTNLTQASKIPAGGIFPKVEIETKKKLSEKTKDVK